MIENIIVRIKEKIRYEEECIESILCDENYAKEETRVEHLVRHKSKIRAYKESIRIIMGELDLYSEYILIVY